MSEPALLALLLRYPDSDAIARRVPSATLHEGLRRLERAGFVTRGPTSYRVTERGRTAMRFTEALQRTVRQALHGASSCS